MKFHLHQIVFSGQAKATSKLYFTHYPYINGFNAIKYCPLRGLCFIIKRRFSHFSWDYSYTFFAFFFRFRIPYDTKQPSPSAFVISMCKYGIDAIGINWTQFVTCLRMYLQFNVFSALNRENDQYLWCLQPKLLH